MPLIRLSLFLLLPHPIIQVFSLPCLAPTIFQSPKSFVIFALLSHISNHVFISTRSLFLPS